MSSDVEKQTSQNGCAQVRSSANHNKTKNKSLPRWLWWAGIILGGVLIGVLILALIITGLIISAWYWKPSDPIQFVTSNLLNVLIFIAIVGQIVVYLNQWAVMRRATELGNRAYVTVKMAHLVVFEANRKASVRLWFINSGNTPAYDVIGEGTQ